MVVCIRCRSKKVIYCSFQFIIELARDITFFVAVTAGLVVILKWNTFYIYFVLYVCACFTKWVNAAEGYSSLCAYPECTELSKRGLRQQWQASLYSASHMRSAKLSGVNINATCIAACSSWTQIILTIRKAVWKKNIWLLRNHTLFSYRAAVAALRGICVERQS